MLVRVFMILITVMLLCWSYPKIYLDKLERIHYIHTTLIQYLEYTDLYSSRCVGLQFVCGGLSLLQVTCWLEKWVDYLTSLFVIGCVNDHYGR